MPSEGVVAVAIAGVALAYRAPLRAGLAATVAVWLLVPQGLHLPWSTHLGVARIVTLALLVGLVARWRRGSIDGAVFRPTVVHGAFAAYLVVALVLGVGLAEPHVPWEQSATAWSQLVDQAVFFVALLAAARATGPWRVAAVVAGAAAVAAAVAMAERTANVNWLAWWVSDLPEQAVFVGDELPRRGGDIRVRVAAQFALEFAWVMAVLFPLTVAVAAWSRRRTALFVPGAVLLASMLGISRSAVAGLALGAGLLVLAAPRDRRLQLLAILGATGVAAMLAVPMVREPFLAAFRTDEVAIRVERLPGILELAAEDPVTGLGLGGLAVEGFPTTDISYVLTYGELGVIGLVALLALWAVAIAAAAGGLRSRAGPPRALAAGALAGAALVPIAAGAYDLSSTLQSTKALWALVVIGVVSGERAIRKPPPRPSMPALPPAARLALPVCALVAGLAVSALVTPRPTRVIRFESVAVQSDLVTPHANQFVGKVLVATACDIARHVERPARTRVGCRLVHPSGGVGELRISATDEERLAATEGAIGAALAGVLPGYRPHPLGPAERARPTAAETAPVWLTAAGAAVAALWPRKRGQVEKRSPSSGVRQDRSAPTNAPAAYAAAPAAPDS